MINLIPPKVGAKNSMMDDVERIKKAASEALDGVQKLVSNLEGSSEAERTEAAVKVNKLLETQATHAIFASVGGVRALVKIFEEGQPEDRRHAINALTKLSNNEAVHAAMLAAGAVSVLVEHCNNLSRRPRRSALLAREEPFRKAFSSAYSDDDQRHFSELKSAVSKFLTGLISYTDHPAYLIASSGGEPLLDLLLRTGNRDEKERVLTVLRLLSEDNRYVISGISMLIPVVAKLVKDADSGLQIPATIVLGNFAHGDQRHRRPIVNAGAIPPLVALLEHSEGDNRRTILNTLHSISCDKENAVAFVQAGVMPILLKMVREENGKIKISASEVIDNLIDCSQGLVALAQAGGVSFYLERIQNLDGMSKLTVERTLHELAECSKAAKVMGADLLVTILVALIRHSDHYKVTNALKQLAKLSEYSDVIKIIANKDVVPLLTEFTTSSIVSRKANASIVLERLSSRSDEPPSKRARTQDD